MSMMIYGLTAAFAAAGGGICFGAGVWREFKRVGMTLNFQNPDKVLGPPRHPARDALFGIFTGAALGLITGVIVDAAPPGNAPATPAPVTQTSAPATAP